MLANRALARCRLGRLGEAVADARQVVTLAPTWAKGHARLGACLQAAMRYNDAVAAFERAAWLARAHDGDETAKQARPRHPDSNSIPPSFRRACADPKPLSLRAGV